MAEIQRADRGARRRLLLALLIVAVVGSGGLLWFEGWLHGLQELASSDPAEIDDQIERLLAVFALLSTLPLLISAFYVWRFGSAVIAAGRFPPPRASVVRDTPVVSGATARRRGYLLRAFALLLATFAIALPVVLGLMLTSVRAGGY